MSSENEVSFAKFFSTRVRTKVPEPWRRTSKPSSTSPSIALRTVMRETAKSSRGRAPAAARRRARAMRFSMASRSARCSCWYSGRLLARRGGGNCGLGKARFTSAYITSQYHCPGKLLLFVISICINSESLLKI